MRMSYTQLKKVSVVTESGNDLGHVRDVVLDVEMHTVVQYEVSSSFLLPKILLIHHDQVVSLTATQMIVRDSVLATAQSGAPAQRTVGQESVAMREES